MIRNYRKMISMLNHLRSGAANLATDSIYRKPDFMSSESAPIDLDMLDDTFGKDGRADIISTFIEHSGLLFSRINTGLEEQNVEIVIDVAHQIKGMGASIYALDLSTQAHTLERIAKDENPDWQLIATALEDLKRCFAKLTGYLDSHN